MTLLSRRSLARHSLLAIPALVVVSVGGLEAQEVSDDWLIASAVLAAPTEFREAAEVRKWNDAGKLVTIREGSGVICIADRPGDGTFGVSCYHDSLEPYMRRGRELRDEGIEGMERQETRWADVDSGKVSMPETAGMVFNLNFPTEDFDPATIDPATGGRLHAVYIPYMTPESTGLPISPVGTEPWLMWPGKAGSHIMISIPARSGG